MSDDRLLLEKMIHIMEEEYKLSKEAVKNNQIQYDYWFGRLALLEKLLHDYEAISSKNENKKFS